MAQVRLTGFGGGLLTSEGSLLRPLVDRDATPGQSGLENRIIPATISNPSRR